MSHEKVDWYHPVRPELIQTFGPLIASQDAAHSHGDQWSDALIQDAFALGATDVHLTPQKSGYQILMRIDGALIDVARINESQGKRLVQSFKTSADLSTEVSFHAQVAWREMAFDEIQVGLRLTSVPTVCGEKLAIRMLDAARLEKRVGELGLSDTNFAFIDSWIHNAGGMLIVCGPIGSGKTTTVYSLLQSLQTRELNIATVEDPVEYQVDGLVQVEIDEKHGFDFAEGIRSLLRLDADMLMLGEIRDRKSAKAALRASASGRTLLTTIHARDAVGTITALRNLGQPDAEIAIALQMVIAQRLVRKLCQSCKVSEEPTDLDSRWLESMGIPRPDVTWHATGCDQCRGSGYDGQTGVFETWKLDESDVQSILKNVDETKLRKSLFRRGHRSLLSDGLDKVSNGETAFSELRKLGPLSYFSNKP